MTHQEYWDHQLTHKGRAKALAMIGRALGYQYPCWRDLPADLKQQLRRLWGRINGDKQ